MNRRHKQEERSVLLHGRVSVGAEKQSRCSQRWGRSASYVACEATCKHPRTGWGSAVRTAQAPLPYKQAHSSREAFMGPLSASSTNRLRRHLISPSRQATAAHRPAILLTLFTDVALRSGIFPPSKCYTKRPLQFYSVTCQSSHHTPSVKLASHLIFDLLLRAASLFKSQWKYSSHLHRTAHEEPPDWLSCRRRHTMLTGNFPLHVSFVWLLWFFF